MQNKKLQSKKTIEPNEEPVAENQPEDDKFDDDEWNKAMGIQTSEK